jgi:probable DNA repair protein
MPAAKDKQMDKGLFSAAQDGALTLTVNDRLSRYLLQQYDEEQRRLGEEAWARPEMLSYSAWLKCFQTQTLGGLTFLNSAQLQSIWESIIEKDMQTSGVELLHVPQTANRTRQAYQLLSTYNADFDEDAAATDHLAYLRWCNKWDEISKTNEWYDPVRLPWLLTKQLTENNVEAPNHLVFAGFDEITPDILNLVRVLERSGCLVEYWQPETLKDVSLQEHKASDPVVEVNQCARWARNILETDPTARIGVVAPQLEAYQGFIERTFAAELEPVAVMSADEEICAFNLSLGKSLNFEEIISAALRLLRIERQVDQSELSWLLHTPYLSGGVAEHFSRAKIDREILGLRRPVWPVVRLSKVARYLSEKHSYAAPELFCVFEKLSNEVRGTRKQCPGAWAEHFSLFLQQLKWPGDRGLSSREFQAVKSFKDVLSELASLDSVSGELSRPEAVQLLSRLVGAKSFQPEGKGAPVQVLGELESAGLQFDHLWVLGLHDRALPSTPSPNPFIPLSIQRHYKMKRADAEREHSFAEHVVERLFAAAPNVVLSWPLQDDGTPLRKSPFVPEDLPEYLPDDHSQAPTCLIAKASTEHETLVDTQGPPLPPRRTFSGGTGILKDQALCPFRAFAHYRLRAEQADTSDIGIDNMSRGTLAHTVLEVFWEETTSHCNLVSLSSNDLALRITKAVNVALDRFERDNRYDLPTRQRSIEALRLRKLTESWLAVEKERNSFTVQAAEKRQQIAIGDLVIRTQTDRIDTLDDGRCAIIDYKTGLPDPSQWLDVRITEPQLPLYCLAVPKEQVGAVMFGVVRGKEKERGFKGLARTVEGWPGAKSKKIDQLLEEQGWEDFEQILEHWQATLDGLGDAFTKGDARIDPVELEKACKYCDLSRLCRIAERVADWQEKSDG